MPLRYAVALIAVLLLAACTPKEKVEKEPLPSSRDIELPPASPDTLEYDFLEEQPAEPPAEPPRPEPDLPAPEEPEERSEPIWTLPEDKPAPQAAEGLFWVQIFATRSHERAEQIAAEAGERLTQRIEVHFLDPYYKVLVGGFDRREPAVELRDRLVHKGYPDAWIFEL